MNLKIVSMLKPEVQVEAGVGVDVTVKVRSSQP
jgi:hypothetical protein